MADLGLREQYTKAVAQTLMNMATANTLAERATLAPIDNQHYQMALAWDGAGEHAGQQWAYLVDNEPVLSDTYGRTETQETWGKMYNDHMRDMPVTSGKNNDEVTIATPEGYWCMECAKVSHTKTAVRVHQQHGLDQQHTMTPAGQATLGGSTVQLKQGRVHGTRSSTIPSRGPGGDDTGHGEGIALTWSADALSTGHEKMSTDSETNVTTQAVLDAAKTHARQQHNKAAPGVSAYIHDRRSHVGPPGTRAAVEHVHCEHDMLKGTDRSVEQALNNAADTIAKAAVRRAMKSGIRQWPGQAPRPTRREVPDVYLHLHGQRQPMMTAIRRGLHQRADERSMASIMRQDSVENRGDGLTAGQDVTATLRALLDGRIDEKESATVYATLAAQDKATALRHRVDHDMAGVHGRQRTQGTTNGDIIKKVAKGLVRAGVTCMLCWCSRNDEHGAALRHNLNDCPAMNTLRTKAATKIAARAGREGRVAWFNKPDDDLHDDWSDDPSFQDAMLDTATGQECDQIIVAETGGRRHRIPAEVMGSIDTALRQHKRAGEHDAHVGQAPQSTRMQRVVDTIRPTLDPGGVIVTAVHPMVAEWMRRVFRLRTQVTTPMAMGPSKYEHTVLHTGKDTPHGHVASTGPTLVAMRTHLLSDKPGVGSDADNVLQHMLSRAARAAREGHVTVMVMIHETQKQQRGCSRLMEACQAGSKRRAANITGADLMYVTENGWATGEQGRDGKRDTQAWRLDKETGSVKGPLNWDAQAMIRNGRLNTCQHADVWLLGPAGATVGTPTEPTGTDLQELAMILTATAPAHSHTGSKSMWYHSGGPVSLSLADQAMGGPHSPAQIAGCIMWNMRNENLKWRTDTRLAAEEIAELQDQCTNDGLQHADAIRPGLVPRAVIDVLKAAGAPATHARRAAREMTIELAEIATYMDEERKMLLDEKWRDIGTAPTTTNRDGRHGHQKRATTRQCDRCEAHTSTMVCIDTDKIDKASQARVTQMTQDAADTAAERVKGSANNTAVRHARAHTSRTGIRLCIPCAAHIYAGPDADAHATTLLSMCKQACEAPTTLPTEGSGWNIVRCAALGKARSDETDGATLAAKIQRSLSTQSATSGGTSSPANKAKGGATRPARAHRPQSKKQKGTPRGLPPSSVEDTAREVLRDLPAQIAHTHALGGEPDMNTSIERAGQLGTRWESHVRKGSGPKWAQVIEKTAAVQTYVFNQWLHRCANSVRKYTDGTATDTDQPWTAAAARTDISRWDHLRKRLAGAERLAADHAAMAIEGYRARHAGRSRKHGKQRQRGGGGKR